jgi:16S rRNA (uracil1498-N3)-methyltransferase
MSSYAKRTGRHEKQAEHRLPIPSRQGKYSLKLTISRAFFAMPVKPKVNRVNFLKMGQFVSRTRLYYKGSLENAKPVLLPQDQSHYISHVLRKKIGDKVFLFNELSGEWQTTITDINKRQVKLSTENFFREPRLEPTLALLFAPLKKNPMEFLVEKATEIGVTHFFPIITDHSHVRDINIERMMAISTEAAEQCERLSLPAWAPLTPLTKIDPTDIPSPILFCAESGEALAIQALLSNPDKPPRSVLIGPEGGFSDSEHTWLRQRSEMMPTHLGPRILRAETAALAALSILQALQGDWR